ncbi:MAG TPA: glutathione S-transferase family protein [Candidatus Limnocylindria bacterium]|nr:glutathione S-transferase family protein [Candidatus Limnocylindria bacterium]
MAIVFGASPSPFVRKVRVALAEKNVPYDLKMVIPGDNDPAFRQMSPLGKIPAFKDGERTLADSSVICAYLERVHPTPALYPSDPYDYARALWFEEYGDTALVQVLGPKVFLEKVLAPVFFKRPTNQEVVDKAVAEEVPPLCEYLEGQLTGDYFVGNRFSIADVAIASPFVNYQHAGYSVDAGRYPKLAAFLTRVHARPSFAGCVAEERAMLGIAA